MTLVVHTHLHPRFTGATRHVEAVIPALAAKQVDARVLGEGVDASLPRIDWSEVVARSRHEPTVVHTHRINELLTALAARASGGRFKLVWTRHATGRPSVLTRWIAARADRIVAVSPESADTLALPAEVVLHGVELNRFAPPADRDRAWDALGVGGRYGIGVIGRVRPDKGQGDFVDAVAPLLVEHPEWRAVLVGLAKPRERGFVDGLRQKAPGLVLAGERRPIEPWYQGLTVTISPSHEESFGLVRLEAMASGSCLVTTRLNALDRMIEHGRTGFVYDAGDVSALREILALLLREPSRAREVGQHAAELARARFGIDHQAEALLALYRALLEEVR